MPAFLPVIQAFNESGVSYVVVGGFATVLHGHLRTTSDIDFAIDLQESNIRKAIAAVKMLGLQPRIPINIEDFARPEIRREWIEQKGLKVVSFFDPRNATSGVDIFASDPMEYGLLSARSELQEIRPGLNVRICSIEDLIALKKHANRRIDQDDVEALEVIRNERDQRKNI